MSILLPAKPGIASAKPRLLDFGGVLTPPGGGAAQRVNRPGSRFAIDITLPAMSSIIEGRIFLAALMQAISQGALYAFPQDMPVGAPGSPVVNGAGQMGTTLNLKNFTPSYAGRAGQFFSIVQGGRRYLHFLAAQGIAGADGTVAASIWPMLRVSPDDGAVCEFAKPMIEGFLSGNALEWQLRTAPYVDVQFTITEAA